MHARAQKNEAPGIGEPIEWAPRLEAILDEQRRICERLEQLTLRPAGDQREGEEIPSDTGELLRVIGERQSLVDQLTTLNAELEPYRREWEWCMGRLEAPCREKMEQRVRELGALVDRIWARDEADRAVLERQRSAVSSELTGISRGRVAMSAYGMRAAPQAPMFQDRSC